MLGLSLLTFIFEALLASTPTGPEWHLLSLPDLILFFSNLDSLICKFLLFQSCFDISDRLGLKSQSHNFMSVLWITLSHVVFIIKDSFGFSFRFYLSSNIFYYLLLAMAD